MTAAATVWNHHGSGNPGLSATLAGVQPRPLAGPANGNTGDSGSTSSTGNSATISANDFLTLLVTEMQNQDPTADTDPNEYINQLVQVNSLEQLIDINQNLTTALGGSSSSSTEGSDAAQVSGAAAGLTPSISSGAPAVVHPAAAHRASALGQVQSAAAGASNLARSGLADDSGRRIAPGNLSVPAARPAASRVAEALSGRTHVE